MELLAYGAPAITVDTYFQIGESTAVEAMKRWCEGIIGVFEETYLRTPTDEDTATILAQNEARGFPGMLGSIDCMHWTWKNCPSAWAGQYSGDKKQPNVILEAVVDQSLWFWHAYFGVPGSNNDKLLYRSNVFQPFLSGNLPECRYTVNGNKYTMGYYLANGIYPQWSSFVQSMKRTSNRKQINFNIQQSTARKDVERGFGVLQARFHIVKASACSHSPLTLNKIMKACIILHNMIVENERDIGVSRWRSESSRPIPTLDQPESGMLLVLNMIARRTALKDVVTNARLHHDLAEHLTGLKLYEYMMPKKLMRIGMDRAQRQKIRTVMNK